MITKTEKKGKDFCICDFCKKYKKCQMYDPNGNVLKCTAYKERNGAKYGSKSRYE